MGWNDRTSRVPDGAGFGPEKCRFEGLEPPFWLPGDTILMLLDSPGTPTGHLGDLLSILGGFWLPVEVHVCVILVTLDHFGRLWEPIHVTF